MSKTVSSFDIFKRLSTRVVGLSNFRLAPCLFALANALGLSEVELRDVLLTEKYAPKIKSDFLGGVRSGVNGTPSFFINGHQHLATYGLEDLVSAIESHLHARAV